MKAGLGRQPRGWCLPALPALPAPPSRAWLRGVLVLGPWAPQPRDTMILLQARGLLLWVPTLGLGLLQGCSPCSPMTPCFLLCVLQGALATPSVVSQTTGSPGPCPELVGKKARWGAGLAQGPKEPVELRWVCCLGFLTPVTQQVPDTLPDLGHSSSSRWGQPGIPAGATLDMGHLSLAFQRPVVGGSAKPPRGPREGRWCRVAQGDWAAAGGASATPKTQAWVGPVGIAGPSELGSEGFYMSFLHPELQVTGRLRVCAVRPPAPLCPVHTSQYLRQQGRGDCGLATGMGRESPRPLTPSPLALFTLSSQLSGSCAGDTEGVLGPCPCPQSLWSIGKTSTSQKRYKEPVEGGRRGANPVSPRLP